MCSIADFAAGDPGPSACCAVSVAIQVDHQQGLGMFGADYVRGDGRRRSGRAARRHGPVLAETAESLMIASTRPGRGNSPRARSTDVESGGAWSDSGNSTSKLVLDLVTGQDAPLNLQLLRPRDVLQRWHLHRRLLRSHIGDPVGGSKMAFPTTRGRAG